MRRFRHVSRSGLQFSSSTAEPVLVPVQQLCFIHYYIWMICDGAVVLNNMANWNPVRSDCPQMSSEASLCVIDAVWREKLLLFFFLFPLPCVFFVPCINWSFVNVNVQD
ncbi:hypothetical protein INR49_020058 [Caranx melampygus]|nr:hypothetical protein INR49_020058 [Caranx melampygus]